jgi:hypothetical protein
MSGTRRAFVVSAGIAICLAAASLHAPPRVSPDPPPPRQIEFEPIATRTEGAPSLPVLMDAPEARPEAKRRPETVRQRVAARSGQSGQGSRAATARTLDLRTIREVKALVPSLEDGPGVVEVSDASDVEVYVPGCVGFAKRLWAAGAPAPEAGSEGRRRNCMGGPPREIVLESSLGGMCANPERDRGLPSMCAQARRRR